jgi:hypothetical protein
MVGILHLRRDIDVVPHVKSVQHRSAFDSAKKITFY